MHRTHHRTLAHWDSPFNFSLRRDVLSQKLELVHLQLGDLVLQLAELPSHHVTLQRHHRHRAGHDLLAARVQTHRHVVVGGAGGVAGVLAVPGLGEGRQTRPLLGGEPELGVLLSLQLHAVQGRGVRLRVVA